MEASHVSDSNRQIMIHCGLDHGRSVIMWVHEVIACSSSLRTSGRGSGLKGSAGRMTSGGGWT